jgi:hypothetical protein
MDGCEALSPWCSHWLFLARAVPEPSPPPTHFSTPSQSSVLDDKAWNWPWTWALLALLSYEASPRTIAFCASSASRCRRLNSLQSNCAGHTFVLSRNLVSHFRCQSQGEARDSDAKTDTETELPTHDCGASLASDRRK